MASVFSPIYDVFFNKTNVCVCRN